MRVIPRVSTTAVDARQVLDRAGLGAGVTDVVKTVAESLHRGGTGPAVRHPRRRVSWRIVFACYAKVNCTIDLRPQAEPPAREFGSSGRVSEHVRLTAPPGQLALRNPARGPMLLGEPVPDGVAPIIHERNRGVIDCSFVVAPMCSIASLINRVNRCVGCQV